jgi:hypothetical protein
VALVWTATLVGMSDEGDSGTGEEEGVYDENGVDRSLVRWMLSLTPAERLAYAESMRNLAERARRDRTP